MTPRKVTLPVRATKFVVVASEAIVILFACVLRAQLTTELNQNLTKVCPEDTQSWAFTQEENTYVKTWGLKRGEGVCSKGCIFRNLVIFFM